MKTYVLDPRRSHTMKRGNWTIRCDIRRQSVDVLHCKRGCSFDEAWVRQEIMGEPIPASIILWLDLHFEEIDYWLTHVKP